jgi:hypothetical protein
MLDIYLGIVFLIFKYISVSFVHFVLANTNYIFVGYYLPVIMSIFLSNFLLLFLFTICSSTLDETIS